MSEHQENPGDLINRAIEHYRAARWEEAAAAFAALREMGELTPELAELDEDIRLKQVYEGLSVTAAAPQQRGAFPLIPLLVAGALGLVAFIGFLVVTTLNAAPTTLPTATQVAAIGALPTAAPTNTPEPTPTPSEGTLLVIPAADGPLTRATGRIDLIFDASGSMLAVLGDSDERKIAIAQQAVTQLIDVLPAESEVSLRTYGRNRADDCSDLELVQPPAPLDRALLIEQIQAITPVNGGRTPIAASLAQIAADPNLASKDILVVLLSDGEESCDGDPIGVAAQLHEANPRLRISVIGFAVDEVQQEQLAAIARAGGGSFFAASDVAQLAGALRQAVVPIYRVFDADNTELAQVDLGEALTLAPGEYQVEIGEIDPLRLTVEVNGGGQTIVEVRDESGALRADVRNEE